MDALGKDFDYPCVTSSRGMKGSRSSMHYILHKYTQTIFWVNWYLANPLSILQIHPLCIHWHTLLSNRDLSGLYSLFLSYIPSLKTDIPFEP